MDDVKLFFEWLLSLPLSQYVLDVLAVIFSLVVMIVQVKKYKLQTNQAKEDIMKYRSEDYQKAKGFTPVSQSFKRVVPVYELNDKTNSLVVVDTKDLQEIVQSSRDCGIDVIFEKYGVLPTSPLPDVSKKSEEVFDASDIRDDFEYLSDVMSEFDSLRERYNMPNASPQELVKHISKLKSDLDVNIQSKLSEEALKSNGGVKDE